MTFPLNHRRAAPDSAREPCDRLAEPDTPVDWLDTAHRMLTGPQVIVKNGLRLSYDAIVHAELRALARIRNDPGRYQSPEHLLASLKLSAQRNEVDRHRRTLRRRERSLPESDSAELADPRSLGRMANRFSAEDQGAVFQELQRLPPVFRLVLSLSVYAQMTDERIGRLYFRTRRSETPRALGLRVYKVRHRALRLLGRRLIESGVMAA